ncbi:MAG: hypothetical protein WCP97_08215 [bacterium]
MEFRTLLQLLKKNFLFIILLTVATTAGSALYVLRKPPSVDVSVSLVTNYESKSDNSTAPYYRFDGYYPFLAAERYSQVVVGVLKSASAAQDIFTAANVPLKTKNVSDLSKIFKPQKRTERVVEVLFSSDSKENGEKLAKGLEIFMKAQSEIASKASGEGSFVVTTSAPVIFPSPTSLIIWIAIGLLSGVVISITLILILHAIKKTS